MAKHDTQAEWFEIDPATLPTETKSHYDNYKALYRDMKAKRDAFEEAMQAGVPEGSRMVFGYRFGKLSVAIVPDDRKAKAAAKSTQSLAEFLASQAQSGRSC